MANDDDGLAPIGSDVLATVGVAVAGLTGHPFEVILGAAGFTALKPVLTQGFVWFGDVLKRAAGRSGRSTEELITGLDGSPEQQELLIRAMETARTASFEEKRRALAAALAHGVTSKEAAMGETMFVRLLDDLDGAHIILLRALGEARDHGIFPRVAGLASPWYYEDRDVDKLVPALSEERERLLAVLRSHGLVQQDEVTDLDDRPMDAWRITTFGQQALRRLSTVALGDEDH